MPTPDEFMRAAQWTGVAALILAGITVLAFGLGWGIRFRLVGVTSFTVVLMAGFFGLSFEPFTPTVIPGAVSYATVFDSGASQIVIKVPPTITESQLEATLRQAASNLLKPSRLSGPGETPTIRARTILHDPPGVSQLVYLGQIQPASPSDDDAFNIELYPDQLARIDTSPDA
ncbi:Ycf51-like protein [Halomicronema hongdechloris C2206]|uniref:Ycf51-like protein n=1 Tax=Halomicronema hongdechloris C2206 TaxID=1641165 RepID=A0A1Z3HUN4_9CYAN|nr:Ycf51 family protein [Halomicronema hongdechloris]ASC73837.1 Ycf51-like protein [Halomicronema hongdechloris C2206]